MELLLRYSGKQEKKANKASVNARPPLGLNHSWKEISVLHVPLSFDCQKPFIEMHLPTVEDSRAECRNHNFKTGYHKYSL